MNLTKTTIIMILAIGMARLVSVEGGLREVVEGGVIEGKVLVEGKQVVEGGGIVNEGVVEGKVVEGGVGEEVGEGGV